MLILEKHASLFNRYIAISNRVAKSIEDIYSFKCVTHQNVVEFL